MISVSTGPGAHQAVMSEPKSVASRPSHDVNPVEPPAPDREALDGLILPASRRGFVADRILDELASDAVLCPAQPGNGTLTIPAFPPDGLNRDALVGHALAKRVRRRPPADYYAGLTVLGLAVGFWARNTGIIDSRKRKSGRVLSRIARSVTAIGPRGSIGGT
jgi:hypothetical protein